MGKTRQPFLRQAEAFYLERVGHMRAIRLDVVRDGDSALPPAKRAECEGRRLLEALEKDDLPIALDERGRDFDSAAFAAFMRGLDRGRLRPCFLIGGAHGLAPQVTEKATHMLCLSALTFTHELARVVLLEQLYRAECIMRGFPYHH